MFFMVGSHVGHDCQVGNKVVFANNTMLGGHVTVGDNVVFGGGVAVRQFVRIGEGAMIVGLSGVRADVIPVWHGAGSACQSGRAQCGRHAPARAFESRHPSRALPPTRRCFSARASFAPASTRLPPNIGDDALVAKMIEFIRAGKRPLTMAVKRGEADEDA